jgi:hypothetical protein
MLYKCVLYFSLFTLCIPSSLAFYGDKEAADAATRHTGYARCNAVTLKSSSSSILKVRQNAVAEHMITDNGAVMEAANEGA